MEYSKTKRTLLLVKNPAKYRDLARSLSSASHPVSVCSYLDLAFSIDGDDSSVDIFPTTYHISDSSTLLKSVAAEFPTASRPLELGTSPKTQTTPNGLRRSSKSAITPISLKNFSRILVLATSPGHRENYIFSALACFCRKNNIEILDDSFSNTDGKLYALWCFWENHLPAAKTAFGPAPFLVEKLVTYGTPAILKSVHGTKGNDNFLVSSASDLTRVLSDRRSSDFILQNFIRNDGDWRIIVVNFEPKLAIFRSAHGKDHRNNTSVGGDAKLVPLEQADPKILELAVAAAKALDIKIAGADILQDRITKAYSVLEVNRTPQLATGAFPEAKLAVLRDLIK